MDKDTESDKAPLQFWFSGKKNAQEIIDEYPKTAEIRDKIINLYSLTYPQVVELYKLVIDLRSHVYKKLGSIVEPMLPPWNSILLDDLREIANRKKHLLIETDPLGKLFYEDMFVEQTVNGYKWCWNFLEPMMDYETFQKLVAVWNNEKDAFADFDEFYKEFEYTACTSWAKMDRYGTFYGGYWRLPVSKFQVKNLDRPAFPLNLDASPCQFIKWPAMVFQRAVHWRNLLYQTVEGGECCFQLVLADAGSVSFLGDFTTGIIGICCHAEFNLSTVSFGRI